MAEFKSMEEIAEKIAAEKNREHQVFSLKTNQIEIKNRADEMINDYLQALQEKGKEDFVTMIKFTALQIYSSLLEVVDVVLAMQQAFSDFQSIFDLIDSSMDFISTSLQSKTDYGLIARWRLRRKTAKYMRNISNRFKSLTSLMESFGKMPAKLQKTMSTFVPSKGLTGVGKKSKGKVTSLDESMLPKDIQAKINQQRGSQSLEVDNDSDNTDASISPSVGKGGTDISDIT